MSLLQIDSLDMLALLGDREQFTASVEWIGKNLRFDIVSDADFSLFMRPTIREVFFLWVFFFQ